VSAAKRRREAQEAVVSFVDEPTHPYDIAGYLTDHRPSDIWVAIHRAIEQGQLVQRADGMLEQPKLSYADA
jgi:hypothetical protein